MLTLAGPRSTVHFTNLSLNSSQSLRDTLESTYNSNNTQGDSESERASLETTTFSVLDLMKQKNIPIERVCLLDPKATQGLSLEDGQGAFEWFLFGVRTIEACT